jgi:hypothetical protein
VTDEGLRRALRDAVRLDAPHVERMTLAAAIVSTALEQAGMRATLVGGGAIEFYAPGAYTTSDVDFVVEGATREKLARVFEALGLTRKDRHWFIDDLFFEVPSIHLEDPYQQVHVGPYPLRVVARETVLAERIVGFRYWKVWRYGLQAIAMMEAFDGMLNEVLLREHLRREQAEDVYEMLRDLRRGGEDITEETLDRIWHSRYR